MQIVGREWFRIIAKKFVLILEDGKVVRRWRDDFLVGVGFTGDKTVMCFGTADIEVDT